MDNRYENIEFSEVTLSNYKRDIENISNSITNNLIYGMNDNIWKGMSKQFFIQKCDELNVNLLNFSKKIDKTIESIQKLKKINSLQKQIESLEEENNNLKLSNLPSELLKINENNEMINTYREIINKLKIEILNDWR